MSIRTLNNNVYIYILRVAQSKHLFQLLSKQKNWIDWTREVPHFSCSLTSDGGKLISCNAPQTPSAQGKRIRNHGHPWSLGAIYLLNQPHRPEPIWEIPAKSRGAASMTCWFSLMHGWKLFNKAICQTTQKKKKHGPKAATSDLSTLGLSKT